MKGVALAAFLGGRDEHAPPVDVGHSVWRRCIPMQIDMKGTDSIFASGGIDWVLSDSPEKEEAVGLSGTGIVHKQPLYRVVPEARSRSCRCGRPEVDY